MLREEEWKERFKEAIWMMCKAGLVYKNEIAIDGVLAITIDKQEVVVVKVSDCFQGHNDEQCMPNPTEDMARKKLLMPVLSQLFGDASRQGGQSNVIISGLRDQETVGRLVFERNDVGEKPRAKLLIQPEALIKEKSTKMEAVVLADRNSPWSASQSAENQETPAPGLVSIQQGPTNNKDTPNVSVKDGIISPKDSPRKPLDLTSKRSLQTVIEELRASSKKETNIPTGPKSVILSPKPLTGSKTGVIITKVHIEPNHCNSSKATISKSCGSSEKQNTGISEALTMDTADKHASRGEKRRHSKSDDAQNNTPPIIKRPRTDLVATNPQASAANRFISRRDLGEMVSSYQSISNISWPPGPVNSVAPTTTTLTEKSNPSRVKTTVIKTAHTVLKSSSAGDFSNTSTTLPVKENLVSTSAHKLEAKTRVQDTANTRRRSKSPATIAPSNTDSGTFEVTSVIQPTGAQKTPKEQLSSEVVIKPHGFGIGMKLEAEDKLNSLVCVATVAEIRLGKLRIHFDGWENDYDFWCYPWSPIIHPVGWCQENDVPLSPPKDWVDIDSFTWEQYLNLTKSVAVSPQAFKLAVTANRRAQRQRSQQKGGSPGEADETVAYTESAKSSKAAPVKKVIGSKIAADRQNIIKKGRAAKPREAEASRGDSGPKIIRYCGKCDSCRLKEDCGKCAPCLEKPQHGGHNTRRSKCLLRKCSAY